MTSFESIRELIVAQVAERAGVCPAAIVPTQRFTQLGLNSLGAMGMLAALGAALGRPVLSTMAWEHPTPESLARHLAGGADPADAGAEPALRGGSDEPIAVIGMACRFPQAASPEAFWALLSGGVDAITEVPAERWDIEALYDADPAAPGKMNTRWGGFLSSVDTFDAGFFGISPREAAQIDPQQRLALELAWEALEDAGIVPAALKDSRTGVFFGAMWMDYARLAAAGRQPIVQHTATGQDLGVVAARVSYTLGLLGPSLTVNTACSSSLVAVHLACQSLLRGESRFALAGALNLMLAPEGTVTMSKFGAMAPDGRSKAFDARANGYVRGEGGGVVALKRLGDAVADGDRVYCVIRGSAVNNDGFSNGLTAPSPRAQQAVVRDACAAAGVAPGDVQYVETHGTGTLLGDPIEAGALGAVLGAGRSAERALRIGSVKTNIGHLEAAAGMAGLIKVVLSMHHRALPPSLHFQTPNPHIAFAALGLRVQTALEPWEGDGVRLLAGVSSFGFGGTNSHVVLEAPAAEAARLVVLSAQDEAGLRARAGELAAQVRTGTGLSLAGVSGASLCRAWQAWRLAVVVRSRAELGAHLDAFGGGQVLPGASVGRAASPAPRVVFMFGGQGSQWQGMGRALLAEPAARAMLERCDRALRPYVQWSLVDRLSGGGAELLDQTDFVQPALFAMQLALCEAWRARGVTPDAVIGQSLGEVAAACVAGGLSVEDGVRVMCTRSQLVLRAMDYGRLLRGGMAVVELSLAAAEEAIAAHGGALSVAVSSGPETTVVAGDIAALHALVAVLQARAVFCRMVRVDYASHCAHMDPLLTELRASLAGVAPRRPAISFYSTVTAAPLDGALVDAEYWARNLREPVLFASTMARLITDGFATFVEVDPHAMLTGAVERCLAHAGRAGLVVASGQRDESEADTLLRASGRLLVAGVPVRVGAEERAMLPVLVSAQSEAGLQAQALRWAQWLEAHPEASLVEVARTAAMHRSALGQRAVVVADDVEGAMRGLRALAEGRPGPVLAVEAARAGGKLAVMFTGQGSQRSGMGRGLAAADPMFAAELAEVCAALDLHLERPLLSVMWAAEGSEEAGLLDRTDFTQPALFALEVALFRRWTQLGLRPDVVLGHSIGELAAACCVGVMSLADAARLVAARGRLMAALPGGGAMVALAATEVELGPVLAEYAGQAELAAINGPTSCVVSGETGAVLAVAARFSGRKQRRLKVSHAFHSPAMDAMLAAYAAVARSVVFHAPTIPVIGGETGQVVDLAVLCTPEHWVRQARGGVRFADAMACAQGLGAGVFLELGPQGVLCGMGAECVQSAARFVPSLRAGREEAESFVLAAGTLWAVGQALDWAQVLGKGRLAELPTTAYVRRRYWLEATARSGDIGALGLSSGQHPWLGAMTRLADGDGLLFTGRLGLAEQPWLADHVVFDTVLVPGTGVLELALAAARAVGDSVVSELALASPLVLPRRGAVRIQVQVEGPDAAGRRGLNLYSRPEDGPEETPWTRHATGVLAGATSNARFDEELTVWPPPGAVSVDLGELYPELAARGYRYGPAFQGLTEVWRRGDVVFARVVLSEALGEGAGEYGLHPALLDAALHALVVDGEGMMVPFAFSEVVLHATGARELRVRLAPTGDGVCVTMADGAGEPVARIGALQLRPATAAQIQAGLGEARSLYRVDWVPVALDGAANAVMGQVLGGDGRLAEAFGLTSISDLSMLLQRLNRGEPAPARLIVDVTGTWSGDDARLEAETLVSQVQSGTARFLAVLQALLAEPRLSRTSLLWVTRGAVAASVDDEVEALVRAPLWGLVRSARSEHPNRVIRLLDLDASMLPPAALGEDGEPELALRHGVVLAARLLRCEDNTGTLRPPAAREWRLNLPARGSLGDLELVAGSAAPLLAGQVRVAVNAAGMNFRDALNALGMVPAPWLGLELAGVVLEVGEGVTQLAVGDRVMGLGQGTFATTTIADARLLARIPAGLSFAEAATIPLVFLTALYALQDLAGLRAGERVLVHAAAGGVGMAAVQLARHYGAEVFATASPGKWAVLRAMGVEHIASSRELGFAEVFLAETGGEGVDVVLNALAGDFVGASLRLLPRGGRFLEMGKIDVRDPAAVASAYAGVTYRAFDLMAVDAARIQGMLTELVRLFEQGVLSPLPLCAYDLRHAPAAFKRLANGRNVGKLVLQPPRSRGLGGTVLITGGTGELGRSLARHLVQVHGVKHLLLTSRRGVAGSVVEDLQDSGAETVTVVACDVADRNALTAVLAAIPGERPLGAVFHLAGVLDDGVVTGLTGERLARVLEPKVAGAWNLHRLTAGMELQAFVLFSSVAGVLGSAGQASYAAANSFLDALAARRRSQGLAGQSLAWGPWASQGGGMTAHLGVADLARMQRHGLTPLAVEAGQGLLEVALGRPEAALVPVRLDLGRMQRGVGEGASLPALLRGLLRPALRRVEPMAIQAQTLHRRLGRLSGAERTAAVLDLVRGEIAAVLGLAGAGAVLPERPLQQLGLDSLMAIELRNRLAARAETTLPATLAFDYPTPDAIAGLLLTRLSADTAAKWNDAEIARKLKRVSIDGLKRSEILPILMAIAEESVDLDENKAVEGADVEAMDDVSIYEFLKSRLG